MNMTGHTSVTIQVALMTSASAITGEERDTTVTILSVSYYLNKCMRTYTHTNVSPEWRKAMRHSLFFKMCSC